MNFKTKLAVAAVLLLVVSVFGAFFVNAQTSKQKGKAPKVVELKSQKATSRGGGDDPNVKSDKQTNDPNAQIDAPPNKGGRTARGAGGCRVQIDNRTKWHIKIYVDGSYRGAVSPWGDSYCYTAPGETKVYAKADFDDGSYKYWGPYYYDCGSGQVIPLKLYD